MKCNIIFCALLVLCCCCCCFCSEVLSHKSTRLKPTLERVFSRRKRALLFPPGSFVKFTVNVGKGLLSTYPKGITMALEEAVYYPIPGSRNDLYPKHLKPTTAAKPIAKPQSTYVYIPGTYWRFKAKHVKPYKYIKAPFIPPSRRIFDINSQYGNSSKPFVKPRPQKPPRIDDNMVSWHHWAKYGAEQAQKYQTPAKYYTKWATPAPKWSKWTQRWRRSAEQQQPLPGHRDRLELFEHLHGLSYLLGFDVKACIMRTICESKRLLLPPGYSMLQDMLRVLFTFPMKRERESDHNECTFELKQKCKINLLIWLLNGKVGSK